MLPDRVLNPGPLTYESGALPIALRGPAYFHETKYKHKTQLNDGQGKSTKTPPTFWRNYAPLKNQYENCVPFIPLKPSK